LWNDLRLEILCSTSEAHILVFKRVVEDIRVHRLGELQAIVFGLTFAISLKTVKFVFSILNGWENIEAILSQTIALTTLLDHLGSKFRVDELGINLNIACYKDT
jgi:hypothetical protein